MNITQTKILDSNHIDNQSKSKIILAEDLIKQFQPLFYEEIRKKQRVLKENKSEVVKLKDSVSLLKTKLIDLTEAVIIEKTRKNVFSMILKMLNENREIVNIKDILKESQSQNINQIKECENKLNSIYKASK